jgi:acyl carrier protein
MSIKREIREFIIENFLFGVPDDRLGDDESLLERGILDSTGVMELVAFLEKTYEILVEDEELDPVNLDSIGRVSAYVRRKQAGVASVETPRS